MVVVTLGDDSVVSAPSVSSSLQGAGAAGGGGSLGTGGTALAAVTAASATGAVGGGGGEGARSPYVLKFWSGVDMAVCLRSVDVAAQMRDPVQQQQHQRWTGGQGGGGGGLPRLTAFAVTPDAMQVTCKDFFFYCARATVGCRFEGVWRNEGCKLVGFASEDGLCVELVCLLLICRATV